MKQGRLLNAAPAFLLAAACELAELRAASSERLAQREGQLDLDQHRDRLAERVPGRKRHASRL